MGGNRPSTSLDPALQDQDYKFFIDTSFTLQNKCNLESLRYSILYSMPISLPRVKCFPPKAILHEGVFHEGIPLNVKFEEW